MKRNVKFNSDGVFDIEDHFFSLDKKNKEANFILEFKSPSEIFDNNCKTKIPMLSDDFSEWISCAIDYTPINYKVNLNVYFDDLEGYKVEELNDIFMKNMSLEFKHNKHNLFSKNKLAYGLIIIGVALLITSLLITSLWKEETIFKDIIFYLLDIATTVVVWEAMTILLVEDKERKSYYRRLFNKLENVSFHKKRVVKEKKSTNKNTKDN